MGLDSPFFPNLFSSTKEVSNSWPSIWAVIEYRNASNSIQTKQCFCWKKEKSVTKQTFVFSDKKKQKTFNVCMLIASVSPKSVTSPFSQTFTMAKWEGIYTKGKNVYKRTRRDFSCGKKKDNVEYNEYSLPGRNNYLWEENIQQLISSDSSSSTLLLGMEFFKESINCSNSIIIIYLFTINSIPTNLGLSHLDLEAFHHLKASPYLQCTTLCWKYHNAVAQFIWCCEIRCI